MNNFYFVYNEEIKEVDKFTVHINGDYVGYIAVDGINWNFNIRKCYAKNALLMQELEEAFDDFYFILN